MTAEAIMIFNTAGVTIVGNTAVSNAARTDNRNFNTGIHVMLNAKPPKSVQKSTVLIAKNKARGRHIGILLYSTDMKYSFGTVKILKNRYYSEDKEDAMFVPKEIVKKLTISGNKYAKWPHIVLDAYFENAIFEKFFGVKYFLADNTE